MYVNRTVPYLFILFLASSHNQATWVLCVRVGGYTFFIVMMKNLCIVITLLIIAGKPLSFHLLSLLLLLRSSIISLNCNTIIDYIMHFVGNNCPRIDSSLLTYSGNLTYNTLFY